MGQQNLPPGFRFSPTDEELVSYYLRCKALGRNYDRATIADVDVYKFEPWDLPGKSALPSKDQEWYFFSAQDKKYSHTARINRTTKKGYWKATGKDRKVFSGSSVIGLKKTLIYYQGRAPNGIRTNWIMHEYRLDEEFEKKEKLVCVAVLCRIRKKGGSGPRNGEQYGAPIFDESVELEEEEANMGKVDNGGGTGHQDVVESKGGGNAYNLTDQVEVWKQMGSSNGKLDHMGSKEVRETGFIKIEPDYGDLRNEPNRKGMVEWDSDLNAYFQSISDASYFQSISDTPSLYEHGGDLSLGYPYLDMQNPGTHFDLDAFPFLPTLSDADCHLLQDYTGSAFDESDIIREMSDLINDGKGVLSSTGSKMLPVACNVPTDGDYIELDDINASLDGFALRPPLHGGVRGRSEEQQLWFMADANAETQALPHSQGLAAHRAWLPTPASRGRPKAVHTALPQAENSIRGVDVSIPISREHCRNSGTHVSGSYSGVGDRPHVVESSTRSYLSKHMSTYTVSKYEMLPAQLCYASSFADGRNCVVAVDDQPATPPVAFSMKGKCNLNADTLRKLPTTPIKLPSSSSVLTKSSEDVAADTSEKRHSSPIYSPLPSSTPSKSSSRSRNVEGPSATQACGQETEDANMTYSNRHRWKAPFRVLVTKAKRTAVGMRIMELENGMRTKFNDKLSALGKPAARFLPTSGSDSPYDSLMQGLLATLCHLVAAVMIFFCLFWGFRVLVSFAFSVSV